MRRTHLLIVPALLLGGCLSFGNEAEPERYSGFDCEQLEQMADAYRATPQQLLQESDPVFRDDGDDPVSLQNDRTLNAQYEKGRRSIALARRQKGC